MRYNDEEGYLICFILERMHKPCNSDAGDPQRCVSEL